MATMISVITAALDCVSKSDGSISGGTSGVSIKFAVGDAAPPRCRNLADDVRTIQKALNDFSPLEGGPLELLKVDGICGAKTKAAIRRFQEIWKIRPKGWKTPDGIVDPDGETIKRLRKGGGAIEDLPGEFAVHIPRVLGIVARARAAVLLARNYLDNSSVAMFGKNDLERAERHFHIGKTANPRARLDQIESIFLNMQTAIGYVPQGVVLAINEPATVASGDVMFAYDNGYHWRGKDDHKMTKEGVHPGSIYLCPRARTLNADAFAYVMIHELAHYVAPLGTLIRDHAYFAKDPPKYRNLDPEKAYLNADCYAQFAYETIGKRDFDTKANTTS